MRSKSANTIAFDASLFEKEQGSRVSLGSLLEAVSEGFNKAKLYDRLAHESNAGLAALCPRREDLPRVVMFGKPRPPVIVCPYLNDPAQSERHGIQGGSHAGAGRFLRK
jgi:hypothetical protein